jgi:hypothetical protein
MRGVGQGVQHRAAVAQPGDAAAIEQVGVDASHLRRAVSTQTHGTPGELVDQFECLKISATPAPVSNDSRCSSNGGMTSS